MSPTDPLDNWTVQVRKGILDLCVLNALQSGERYGYDLIKSLAEVPGLCVTEGTIYPLLSRLRVQGLVKTRLEESPEGPARKYYALTTDGKKIAQMMNDYLENLVKGSHALLKGGSKP